MCEKSKTTERHKQKKTRTNNIENEAHIALTRAINLHPTSFTVHYTRNDISDIHLPDTFQVRNSITSSYRRDAVFVFSVFVFLKTYDDEELLTGVCVCYFGFLLSLLYVWSI